MALIDLSGRKRAPFTARRMATLGFFVTLLIVVGWLHFTGAAATRGIERKDMDWNGDGNVTMREMLQSFYAVTVTTTITTGQGGTRECRSFAFRGSEKTLRVDCRTVVQPAAE
ncbi:EF-hand domain-containing protein [Lysobacter auxotrophicus]|uniref:EF-hand domain-containing protein n=1 Tax=Lysobacter auxotrophicus TaxID=2992573 RepID=A0ABM8DGE1_9GAMM|nr:EF-hand domain-containing protein [Lysobacter auxotrophicus]BDU17680.1 EF-hand domain-containing protein [Lysobacter auxotrophicus]